MELYLLKNQENDINKQIISIYKDKNINRILNSIVKKIFLKNQIYLYRTDIKSIKLYTIWKTIVGWNQTSDYKKYLISSFKYNLLKEIKYTKKRKKLSSVSINENITENKKEARQYDLSFLDYLNNKDRDILTDYYLKSMTFKEIGEKNNYSTQRAEQVLKTAIKNTQKMFKGV